MAPSADLTLYTAGTPNGWKPSIVLEELDLPYKVVTLDIFKNETKEPWFETINPNGRIPALTDHETGQNIFESGAIMWYLCEKFDQAGTLLPKDLVKRTDAHCWLMFQMGGVGPMQGQANHFIKYCKEDLPYAKSRYLDETKRLYGIMDKHLKDNEWLAAGQYSLADIANFSWVAASPILDGIKLEEFPSLKKWYDIIKARPAVTKGLNVPTPYKFE